MANLISVVGNTGVGKTTFVRQLCASYHYDSCLEQHVERPFQALFSADRSTSALPNQIDYMLVRAEQELKIRRGALPGVQDGGLDEDFYVFSRLFFQNGYLDEAEFSLCQREYATLRQLLPEPDLFVWLQAPVSVIAERFQRRNRELGIADQDDLLKIDRLLQDWLSSIQPGKLITIDTTEEDMRYSQSVQQVHLEIEDLIVFRE